MTLKAGEFLLSPVGRIHAAKNVGSGNRAGLATYVVKEGSRSSRWSSQRRREVTEPTRVVGPA
jgi:hypothetical protein